MYCKSGGLQRCKGMECHSCFMLLVTCWGRTNIISIDSNSHCSALYFVRRAFAFLTSRQTSPFPSSTCSKSCFLGVISSETQHLHNDMECLYSTYHWYSHIINCICSAFELPYYPLLCDGERPGQGPLQEKWTRSKHSVENFFCNWNLEESME